MRLRADQKLFLSYLVLISAVVAALSFGAELLLHRQMVAIVEAELHRELVLGRALYDAAPELTGDGVARRIGELSGQRVTVISRDGTVLGESNPPPEGTAGMENHRGRPEVEAALGGREGRAVRRSETVGTEHLYMATLSARGEVIRFAVPLSEIEAAVDRAQRGILAVGAAALFLAGLFSFGFSLAITRPLRRIQGAATAMAAGNFSLRLRERRPDELGDLARALDSMAEELQRRLAQLEEERAEMQALIDSMSEGVLAISPDGALRRANPAARQMFALPDSPQGMPPEAVARRPEFLRLVERALAGEAVPPRELTGDGRALLGTAHPLPEGGAVLVFLDVSELRRLEEVRRDFVANASHELKTPLTALRGYGETLLDPDLSPELRDRFSRIVLANAERLQRIVDDLLDLSRIESGGWALAPEEVTIEEAAREAWLAQPRGDGEAGPELRLDVAEGAERVFADAAALHQVFTNLFSNARRYTPVDGAVTVRARPLASLHRISRRRRGSAPHPGLGVGRAARWVSVEVEDTGSGIPAAHLPRVFERFYRADPGRSRAEGGTGLGLAIVKHLVEAHGGQVEAESRVGRGTTIRFSLPARDPAAAESRPPFTPSQAPGE